MAGVWNFDTKMGRDMDMNCERDKCSDRGIGDSLSSMKCAFRSWGLHVLFLLMMDEEGMEYAILGEHRRTRHYCDTASKGARVKPTTNRKPLPSIGPRSICLHTYSFLGLTSTERPPVRQTSKPLLQSMHEHYGFGCEHGLLICSRTHKIVPMGVQL